MQMRSASLPVRAAVVVAMIALITGVSAAASLTVTVVDAANGTPLAKSVVAVVSGDQVLAAGRTNEQGVWTGTVPQGQAHVTASKRLYASAGQQNIAFPAEGARNLRFELTKHQSADFRRLGRIVGFARNPAGQPVANATLVLLRGSTPVGAAQPEQATGVYELEWYPPGPYSVLATAPNHRTMKHSGQSISAGESLWLDVTLQTR
jgi:hypothetical protein